MNPALGQQLLPYAALKAEISGYALVLIAMRYRLVHRPAQRPPARFRQFKPEGHRRHRRHLSPGGDDVFISLTLFIMPMMVASAINQVFAMAGGVAFPYAYYLLAFVASTALALIARPHRTLHQNFVLLHGAAGFLACWKTRSISSANAPPARSSAVSPVGRWPPARRSNWITACAPTGHRRHRAGGDVLPEPDVGAGAGCRRAADGGGQRVGHLPRSALHPAAAGARRGAK